MKVRQLIQILVFPKSFNVCSFYSKGNYAIRIALSLQNKADGTIIQALPVIIEGKDARSEEQKKAKVNTTMNTYQTEQFFVTFCQQKIVFNTACLFKVQYEVDQHYQTFFDFEIIYCSSKRKAASDGQQMVKLDKIVDKRRFYVNTLSTLNRFKRVLFDDSDYFSYTDVLFISQSFGQKIRLHNYQYGDFHNYDVQTRQKYTNQAYTKWVETTHNGKCALIESAFNESIEMYYSRMIIKKVLRYRKLCQIYQKYSYHMANLNNSSSNIFEEPVLDQMEGIKVSQTKKESTLMDDYQTENISEIYLLIYSESQLITRNIKKVWKLFLDKLITINFNLMDELALKEIDEERRTKTKWLLTYADIIHDEAAERRSQFVSKREQIVERMDLFQDNDRHHPFLIIENFTPQPSIPKQRADIDSLVIMVHGYQGSSVDLEKARNFMNIYNPNCYGLLIKTIEDDIDNPIETLGQAVAQEVRLHILNSLNNYKRINFIGYSLGGIIARQSVKHLDRYKDLMNIFISFASPHVGICDSANPLVRAGIWFLTSFEKNKNLKQLNCQPIEDTNNMVTMINLSECESISWFKRFVAVSSKEDHFVPYESSRLEQSSLNVMARQICLNFKKKIKHLERVDVWFDISQSTGTFDKIIGRKSHIQFLENRLFLDCFFAAYGQLL